MEFTYQFEYLEARGIRFTKNFMGDPDMKVWLKQKAFDEDKNILVGVVDRVNGNVEYIGIATTS